MLIKDLTTRSLKVVAISLILASTLAPGGENGGYREAMANDEDWQPVVKKEDEIDCYPDSEEVAAEEGANAKPTSGESGVGEGDVFVEGSEANKVAQEIFDIATEEYGFSGAFAVGMLANVEQESAFIPDRAESAMTGPAVVKFGMNSKKVPAGAGNTANPGDDPGGGLFQFTPFTKFTDSEAWGKLDSGKGWAVENQMYFMFESSGSEFTGSDPYVIKALRGAITDPARNPSGLKAYDTAVDMVTTDDPERATWAFQSGYERPGSFDQSRVDRAKKFDDFFNKDNVKGDPKKAKEVLGASSESSGPSASEASKKKDNESQDFLDVCKPGETAKAKFDWLEDWTGDHGLTLGNNAFLIRPKEIEKGGKYEDIAKYFIDPKSIGMEWGKDGLKNGWADSIGNPSRGECVDLTAAFAGNLWWKDGERSLEMLNSDKHGSGTGNGDSTAHNLGAAYSGKTGSLSMSDKGMSKKPSKGALYSYGGGEYGHTGVVTHTFENGDIAVVEQNVKGYSGNANGQVATWNFAIYPKSYYESKNTAFFDPSDHGYEPNPEALGKSSKKDSKKDDKKDDKKDSKKKKK